MIGRARKRAYRALNRRGLRTLLGLARSAEILLRDRELCLVRPYGDTYWQFRCRRTVMLSPRLNVPPPGRLERRVLDVFCHSYAPRLGDTVLDVGAGLGREALVFSRLVGQDGRVHCVEAHPNTFRLLRSVVELNRTKNIHCHHAAISNAAGMVAVSTEQEAEKYHRQRLVSAHEGVAVSATTLADFLDEQHIEAVDLLAMNVEGAELAALNGMAPVADRVRNVAVACHDFVADRTGAESMRTKEDVRRFLVSHGFSVTEPAPAGPAWRRDFVYGRRLT